MTKYTLDQLTEINKNINEMNSLLTDKNQELTKLVALQAEQIRLHETFMETLTNHFGDLLKVTS